MSRRVDEPARKKTASVGIESLKRLRFETISKMDPKNAHHSLAIILGNCTLHHAVKGRSRNISALTCLSEQAVSLSHFMMLS